MHLPPCPCSYTQPWVFLLHLRSEGSSILLPEQDFLSGWSLMIRDVAKRCGQRVYGGGGAEYRAFLSSQFQVDSEDFTDTL